MARRLEWEKAARRDRHRTAQARHAGNQKAKDLAAKRQMVIADFAAKHNVRCFKCNADRAEWAKSGTSKRGPWIICVPCVKAANR